MKRKALLKVKEICKNKSRIVILDKVMNPTNVGAIIRSAAVLGMDAVILKYRGRLYVLKVQGTVLCPEQKL